VEMDLILCENLAKFKRTTTNFYQNFNDDIIHTRNLLAHIKINPQNSQLLFEVEDKGKMVQFDEAYCRTIREKLLTYEKMFVDLNNKIESY
ncbi:MAG: hypothetical protein RR512_08900, partial [Coprobacillus sp.]